MHRYLAGLPVFWCPQVAAHVVVTDQDFFLHEVHVTPLEPAQLTQPHAGHGRRQVKGVEVWSCAFRRFQQDRHLLFVIEVVGVGRNPVPLMIDHR